MHTPRAGPPRPPETAHAPAALLARLRAAAHEEADHAQRCFALASQHAGRPLAAGPTPLPAIETDAEALRARLIDEAWRDGLLGEAGAAAHAAQAAARTTCPQARATLRRIARDEADHARLSAAILAHCLRVGGPAAKDALADTLRAPPPGDASAPPAPRLAAWLTAAGQLPHAPLTAEARARAATYARRLLAA